MLSDTLDVGELTIADLIDIIASQPSDKLLTPHLCEAFACCEMHDEIVAQFEERETRHVLRYGLCLGFRVAMEICMAAVKEARTCSEELSESSSIN